MSCAWVQTIRTLVTELLSTGNQRIEEHLRICKEATTTTVMQFRKRMVRSQGILKQVILAQTRVTSTIREDSHKNSLYAGLVICVQEVKL